jgi:hypothetical protein
MKIFVHGWASCEAHGPPGQGPDTCPEGLDGLREVFGRRPSRHKVHHRHAQPLGGCLITAEGFRRIVNLAFTAALLSRQQDLPGFLEELLG